MSNLQNVQEAYEKMTPYEALTLSDDFMFNKVMQDSGNCKTMLERLTGNRIEDIVLISSQHSVKITKDSKGVRYDILVEDSRSNLYNSEMQNKNVGHSILAKRARYYEGMLDLGMLESGGVYEDLKNSYVIFICRFDPFGMGLSCYTFAHMCMEAPELVLNDGRKIMFYNTKGTIRNAGEKVLEFLDYIEHGKVIGEFSRILDEAVVKARMNKEWRIEYMKNMVFYWDAKREGRQEGIQEGRLQLLDELIKAGKLTVEEAAEQMKITVEEFEVLLARMNITV